MTIFEVILENILENVCGDDSADGVLPVEDHGVEVLPSDDPADNVGDLPPPQQEHVEPDVPNPVSYQKMASHQIVVNHSLK